MYTLPTDSKAVGESSRISKPVTIWLLQRCEVNEHQLTRKLNTSESYSAKLNPRLALNKTEHLFNQ